MKPGDIVCRTQNGKSWFWIIEGVFLGAEGQESVVELRSLTERPANIGPSTLGTTFVPEVMLRDFAIYTPHIRAS